MPSANQTASVTGYPTLPVTVVNRKSYWQSVRFIASRSCTIKTSSYEGIGFFMIFFYICIYTIS